MKEVLKIGGLFFLGMLLIVGVPFLVMVYPTVSGVVIGVALSAGLAYLVTMVILSGSNDLGIGQGQYQDFAEEPMEVKEFRKK